MVLPFWILVLLTAVAIYVTDKIIRKYVKFRKRIFLLSKIPGPTPEFFWGNARQVRQFFFYFLVYGSSDPNFCILEKKKKKLFLTFFIFSDVKNCQI